MNKNQTLILAINIGSTSSKLALYDGEQLIKKTSVTIPPDALKKYPKLLDQKDLRKEMIFDFLKEQKVEPRELAIVCSQAGAIPGVKSGAYKINDMMVKILENCPTFDHPANLGNILAFEIAKEAGVTAIIYDGNTTDEMDPIAKITGIKGLERIPTSHVLNTKQVARLTAKKLGRTYEECDFIIAHLGGGISVNAHKHGLIVDDMFDDEGPMAPTRAGLIPACQLIDLCCSGQYSRDELQKMIRGRGGLVALTGIADSQEIEKRISEGDEECLAAYKAMAYQVSKGICALASVFSGKVDGIILTGGISNSDMFTGWIKERVEFIAPVEIVPGEFEMEAMAGGSLRVLNGEEEAKIFDDIPEHFLEALREKGVI